VIRNAVTAITDACDAGAGIPVLAIIAPGTALVSHFSEKYW
jgi:hypothetical protein